MAESASSTAVMAELQIENKENQDTNFEPEKKRVKLDDSFINQTNKLEDRLCGILCCAVCLDLPRTCFQCSNGHLMCAGCFNHLLADARLRDETATCPNCRGEISKSICTRNLAVEKAVSELPTLCQYCNQELARNSLDNHEKELCVERPSVCKYSRIGCPWRGPYHELVEHEANCSHPHKSGDEIMEALDVIDKKKKEKLNLYNSIFSLLSFEKVTFNDLQLKPYRSDDFIAKLFYESSRFSAFNQQWVIKARVNNHERNPTHTTKRILSFQLVLKNRASNPISVHYLALKGPYGDMKVNPAIHRFEFSNDKTETEYHELPTIDSVECNKMIASKTINLRLLMFQVQQS
ncbi:hypothetical protein ScPMuIL_000842 [Solemya velum]